MTVMLSLKKILVTLLIYAAHGLLLSAQADDHYVAVMSPPPSIHTMSSNEARAIFSMRVRTWPDGSPITVFVLPDRNPANRKFFKNQLMLLPHQLKRTWERMVYTGIGSAPITVRDEADMLRRLKEVPGSIGYLSQGVLSDHRADLNQIAVL